MSVMKKINRLLPQCGQRNGGVEAAHGPEDTGDKGHEEQRRTQLAEAAHVGRLYAPSRPSRAPPGVEAAARVIDRILAAVRF